MTYSVLSHDAWGSASVGSFTSLAQAREVFEALQKDRWFLADGTVRGLSIVEASSPRFQESCHPCDQYTRGLEDMTNASLQRGR
ncbi:hypothetical protein [Vulcanococcus sp.]|uniref:hypothetical protein n=1 Tax=Vulcanococcus sp. TaxID=2856995 RepID=UPI0037DA634B